MIRETKEESGFLPTGKEDKEPDADYNEEVMDEDEEGANEVDDDLGDEY